MMGYEYYNDGHEYCTGGHEYYTATMGYEYYNDRLGYKNIYIHIMYICVLHLVSFKWGVL